MDLFTKMINIQVILILMILTGVILSKTGVITRQSRKGLGDVLINGMVPASVVSAFQGANALTPELMKNCLTVFFISLATELLAIVFGGVLFRRYKKDWRNIMHYGMIVSNTFYIGIPVAGTLFGNTGLLYASLYFIPGEIAMWSYALALFQKDEHANVFKMIISAPPADAVFVGLILMLLQIRLPGFMLTTLDSIGSCTTPISMLVIGAILADADYRRMFTKPMFHFAAIRLLVFPLLLYIPMRLLQLDRIVLGIGLVMAAMPAAAATSILADKYDSDAEFATQIVIVSTILSIITIPVLTLLI